MSNSILDPNKAEIELIHLLYRVRYSTVDQIVGYLGWSKSKASRILSSSVSKLLIQVDKNFTPNVFYLKDKGFKLVNDREPDRVDSGELISHKLFLNKVELKIREINNSAKVMSRKYCVDLGLFPSFGEYLVKFNSGCGLLILDTHEMDKLRLIRSLTRVHLLDKTKFNLEKQCWHNHVSCVVVYTSIQNRHCLYDDFHTRLKMAAIDSTYLSRELAAKNNKVNLKAYDIFMDNKNIFENMPYEFRYLPSVLRAV